MPSLNSLSGLLLYSFLAYVCTFLFSWIRVKLVNDHVDFGASARQAIIDKRKEKSKAAKELLEAMKN